jgi:hypothetical protein
MLIHRQNSYAPRSKRCTGLREMQSRGTGQQSKNPPCITTPRHILQHGNPQGKIHGRIPRTGNLIHTELW